MTGHDDPDFGPDDSGSDAAGCFVLMVLLAAVGLAGVVLYLAFGGY